MQAAPPRIFEPQDPLNRVYDNHNSQTLDRRDREQRNQDLQNSPLPNPLDEVPRDFRDERFTQRLARQNLNRTSGEDWRTRDDTAFDPLGIPAGGFIFYPELYSRLITTNNLFATDGNEKSDYALEITPTFRLRSDWNNHELEFFVTGTNTRWRNFSTENTTEYEARLRGRVDVTVRTSVEGGVRFEQKMEGRGSVELPDAASSPAKTRQAELFGQVNHRFNRLGFRLRGQFIRNIYEDVALNNGTIQDNHLRDYDEQLLELRTSYEFSPRLSLFADTGIGQRVFRNRRNDGGLLQGSKSWLGAVGARIEFTSNLSFSGRVGYAKADSDEPGLVDLQGVIYDASLIWNPTRLVNATINGKTEIVETTQTGSPGSMNRSVSFEVNKSWTHRLSSTLSGEYEVRDYAGIDQIDKEISVGLVMEYLFSRSWGVDAGYEHRRIEGSNKSTVDELHLGVKWRR